MSVSNLVLQKHLLVHITYPHIMWLGLSPFNYTTFIIFVSFHFLLLIYLFYFIFYFYYFLFMIILWKWPLGISPPFHNLTYILLTPISFDIIETCREIRDVVRIENLPNNCKYFQFHLKFVCICLGICVWKRRPLKQKCLTFKNK